MKTRTRFAPSPTGYLHIGGLRTALYAYLIAKQSDGDFILRIEDTDQERYVEGAVEVITRTLKDTGLCYDEGPDAGGDYGPYVQSERRAIYKEQAQRLCERGGAYHCFCSKERLDELRAEHEAKGLTFKYDKHCLSLSEDEVKRRIAAGESYVIRQNVPLTGETGFDDAVFGHVSAPNDTLDDAVLMKSDGLPTYNFANVVDDHLMGMTDIVRGTEYLSSTPKYNLIYEAMGWEIPRYIHVPPVMRDAKHKLSKRDGDASFEDFVNKGYLKEAILNYIALLGWSPGDDREVFTLAQLVEAFDVKGISKSPAIFDVDKLTWMNAQYVRAMSEDEYIAHARPYWEGVFEGKKFDERILARILQPRTEVFTDIAPRLDFLMALPEYDLELYTHKKMKTNPELAKEVLDAAKPVLEGVSDWNEQPLHDALMGLVEKLSLKNGQVLWPLRIAVCGKAVTPGGAIEALALLGKDESLRRLGVGREKLSK